MARTSPRSEASAAGQRSLPRNRSSRCGSSALSCSRWRASTKNCGVRTGAAVPDRAVIMGPGFFEHECGVTSKGLCEGEGGADFLVAVFVCEDGEQDAIHAGFVGECAHGAG